MIPRSSSRLCSCLHRSRACYTHTYSPQTTSLFTSQTFPFFTSSNNQPSPSPSDPHHSAFKPLSDQEWEIRTGRAIYVLQQTLPDFFTIGLITSVDKSKLPVIVDGSKSRKRQKTGSVADVVGGVGSFVVGHRPSKAADANDDGDVSQEDQHSGDIEPIYSSKVQLVYTPQGFERSLHIEGAPLYITSSLFVRHTLNALYSDLQVDLLTVRVLTTSPTSLSTSTNNTPRGKSREKSLYMKIGVTGLTRVSGGKSEWEVDCTYTFSPLTGLILIHTVNSIQPAPHQAVYDAFRLGFGKLGLGFNGSGGGGRGVGGAAPGSICKGHDRDVCSDISCQGRAKRAQSN